MCHVTVLLPTSYNKYVVHEMQIFVLHKHICVGKPDVLKYSLFNFKCYGVELH